MLITFLLSFETTRKTRAYIDSLRANYDACYRTELVDRSPLLERYLEDELAYARGGTPLCGGASLCRGRVAYNYNAAYRSIILND